MYDSNVFTNVNKYVDNGKGQITYTGILVASKLNQKNGQWYKLLDAVDIDWNGAWISSMKNTYLNTTEDLVNVLNILNKQNELGSISYEIENIWDKINEISSTYVTYTYLSTHLNEHWQSKLTWGNNIGFDAEQSTVYTYDIATYTYLVENYTSKLSFNSFVDYVNKQYYNKEQTDEVAQNAAYDAVMKVIAGADERFDTLKEIADWILEQSIWVEVDIEEIKDILNDSDSTWPLDTYYIYDEETATYIPVNDINFIDLSGATQYWKKENYLIEVKRLAKRVDSLDERVGYAIFDEDTSTYTYSGLFSDVNKLKQADKDIYSALTILNKSIIDAAKQADAAYDLANSTYDIANSALTIATNTHEQLLETQSKVDLTYDIAIVNKENIGTPSIKQEFIELNYDDINSYIVNSYVIYYKTEDGRYYSASEPYDENTQYYYEQPYVEGTGLMRRVEKVEDSSNKAINLATSAIQSSYESLYHLQLNNENSTYIKLGLHPDKYQGDRDRILSITTEEAVINSKTGKVENSGMMTVTSTIDLYSYMSSWMMLYVDQDIDYPEN